MLKKEMEEYLGLSAGEPEKTAPEQEKAPEEATATSKGAEKQPYKQENVRESVKSSLGMSSRAGTVRSASGTRRASASSATRDIKTPLVYTSAVEAAENSFTPGAGAYQLEKSFKSITHKSPAYTLASRHQSYLLTNPTGPGQYKTELSTLDHRGGEFVKSEYYSSDLKKSAVGPGSYNLRTGMENRGITLSGRYYNTLQQSTPGVGAYNVDRRDKAHHAYTLSGRSDKFMNLYAAGTTNAPGVGAYNVGEKLTNHGAKFTKFEPQNSKNEVPGVGTYNVAPQRSRSAGLSLSGRFKGHHF